MNVKKNALSKVIAFLLAALLVVESVPVNDMAIVKAAEKEPMKVVVAEKNIYLYGVDNAQVSEGVNESGQYEISYSGSDNVAVYVNDVLVVTDKIITNAEEDKLLIDKEWLESQTSWVGICFGTEGLSEIKEVNVEVYSKEYDGEEHETVKVNVKNAIVTYSEDGTSYSTTVPKIKNVGTKQVFVRVEREGYKTYNETFTAEVKKAELKGVGVNEKFVCNKVYTGTAYPIIEDGAISKGEKDVVAYQKEGASEWVADIPMITAAGEYSYVIRITSEDGNYEYKKEITAKIKYANFEGKYEASESTYLDEDDIHWVKGHELTIKHSLGWNVSDATKASDHEYDWKESISVSSENDGTGEVSIVAKNTKDEITEDKSIKYGFDTTAPTVGKDAIVINIENQIWDIFNVIKDEMTIKIPVTDDGSGVKEVILKVYGKDSKLKDVISVNEEKGYAKFNLIQTNGDLKVLAVDKLGNSTEEIEVGKAIFDDKAPIISEKTVTYDDENVKEIPDEYIYNGNISIGIKVDDTDVENYSSGLAKIKINNNDTSLEEDTFDKGSKIVSEIKLDEVELSEGKNSINIYAEDHAKHSVKDTIVVYKDTTAPTIKGFEINEGNETLTLALNKGEYYFPVDTKIQIIAEDLYENSSEGTAGVQTIYYKLEGDVYGKIELAKDWAEAIKGIVPVPESFKGKIKAYAVDNLGNKINIETENPDFVKVITETKEAHKETSKIEIVPNASKVNDQVTKGEIAYKGNGQADKELSTGKDVPLYNESKINFTIKVEDSFSGIKNIKYGLYGSDEYKGEVNAETPVSEILTSKEINFTVSGNQNDMVLYVELTDNAGNTSYDYYQFGIDTTKPVVEVKVNGAPSGDNEYYDTSRSAIITIKERNFDAEKVVLKATRDGKEYAIYPEFTYKEGSGHDTTYEAKIEFAKEGDYKFEVVSCTDLAKNVTNGAKYQGHNPQKFTIDKTNPTISVAYNNNSAQNGKYFKANRTATITVVEHNFSEDRVEFTQTAKRSGSSISVPKVSWRHNGDTHTATITYNTDGDYTFDVKMTDKAARKNNGVNYGNSVAAKDFTVDTTITEPTIGGVKNGNAYKDEVVPTIKFEDINFDNVDVKLTRTSKGEKNVDVTKEFIKAVSKNSTGGSSVIDTFKKVAKNDGIYTLTVKIADKAGNTSEKAVTFTVNRYGSVYEFDDYLTSLQDSYVQKVDEPIVFTEYNASKLVKGTVKLVITKDGAPIANPVYEISPVVNDKAKVGTSGWYEYEYTIDPSNFKEDGVYRITLVSEDGAGNVSETANYEECEMIFYVDSTPAEITNIQGLEETIVNANELQFSMEVYDAIGLKSITVYVNDEVVEVFENMEDLINFMGSYTLGEGSNQKIRIVVEDLAGNITDTSAEEFESEYVFNDTVTVSTNFFVRWYANKPLFFGSIAAIVAVTGGFFWFIFGKRKKDEEEERK